MLTNNTNFKVNDNNDKTDDIIYLNKKLNVDLDDKTNYNKSNSNNKIYNTNLRKLRENKLLKIRLENECLIINKELSILSTLNSLKLNYDYLDKSIINTNELINLDINNLINKYLLSNNSEYIIVGLFYLNKYINTFCQYLDNNEYTSIKKLNDLLYKLISNNLVKVLLTLIEEKTFFTTDLNIMNIVKLGFIDLLTTVVNVFIITKKLSSNNYLDINYNNNETCVSINDYKLYNLNENTLNNYLYSNINIKSLININEFFIQNLNLYKFKIFNLFSKLISFDNSFKKTIFLCSLDNENERNLSGENNLLFHNVNYYKILDKADNNNKNYFKNSLIYNKIFDEFELNSTFNNNNNTQSFELKYQIIDLIINCFSIKDNFNVNLCHIFIFLNKELNNIDNLIKASKNILSDIFDICNDIDFNNNNNNNILDEFNHIYSKNFNKLNVIKYDISYVSNLFLYQNSIFKLIYKMSTSDYYLEVINDYIDKYTYLNTIISTKDINTIIKVKNILDKFHPIFNNKEYLNKTKNKCNCNYNNLDIIGNNNFNSTSCNLINIINLECSFHYFDIINILLSNYNKTISKRLKIISNFIYFKDENTICFASVGMINDYKNLINYSISNNSLNILYDLLYGISNIACSSVSVVNYIEELIVEVFDLLNKFLSFIDYSNIDNNSYSCLDSITLEIIYECYNIIISSIIGGSHNIKLVILKQKDIDKLIIIGFYYFNYRKDNKFIDKLIKAVAILLQFENDSLNDTIINNDSFIRTLNKLIDNLSLVYQLDNTIVNSFYDLISIYNSNI